VTTRLEHLASLKGIALEYEDVWGKTHHTEPVVLVALLAAMHVAAADDEAIEQAIAAHETGLWHGVLPAAWVLGGTPSGAVPLRLPVQLDGASLSWRLAEEGGRLHQGDFRAADLAEVERASIGATSFVARALPLPVSFADGYHRLTVLQGEGVLGECLLVAAPKACYVAPALAGDGRVWGAAVQLYAVRSEHNWGIGDFADLAALIEQWGVNGASVVGVNPLHALFPHNPAHASPYSPSSRLFLNTLYLDVEAIDDYGESDAARSLVRSAPFQAQLKRLRGTETVDYPGVAEAKRQVLEMLFAHFRAQHLAHDTARAQAFHAFRARAGESLYRHALFEALQEHFFREDSGIWGWPQWPQEYRSPDASAVQQFAQEHADRVDFYGYLQWQADVQLETVGRRSFELGLGVGLYEDLAVSIDRAGAEAWARQDLYAIGASVGAPPDVFNLKGQNWGLPPLVPQRLSQTAYAPFIDTLRANMRHSGALRIDHVMALMRLYWIADGADASHGAYVHYPFDDLLAIVRLESQRNRCVVIGEDLGTVPPEVHEKLAVSGVLSYRVLYFERDAEGGFLPPSQFEPQALVAGATHDLPTLAGWWDGHDLELRARLRLFPQPELREQQVIERAQDRARLLLALEREELLPPQTTVSPVSIPKMTSAFCRALHQYLARSPSKIVLAQLEDVLEVREQINQPGTTDAYPNWQRKLPLLLERWPADERFVELARMFERERGRVRMAVPRRAEAIQAVIPRATYRMQLHRDFTFADAAAQVPYLARLGISHLYCSPFLRARAGSRHGYDIVDHNALNPEIGNRDDLEHLVATLRSHGMGLLIDVVPNHMGVLGGDNGWWLDVLENGAASMFAEFFDIDWTSSDPALTGKVLLPILGDQYGVILERGELKLGFEPETGSFVLRYFEHRLPIDPVTYPSLLASAQRLATPNLLPSVAVDALASLGSALGHLPVRDAGDGAARTERHRDKEVHKAQLARLTREYPPLLEGIERAVTAINGSADDRASFAALDELIELQAYRLAYWRVAADEINYRRFFDINELAALRMERVEVFDATHRLVLDLAASGKVDGLRIDHPDGLLDPAGYFRRLQERYAQLVGYPGAVSAGEEGAPAWPLYVVAEKIIAPHEQLPADWALHGTTGYRFANVVNGLFIDPAAKPRLDRAWRAFVRDEADDFEELAYRCRRIVMATSLSGELTVLANALLRLARADRRTRDFTLNSLRLALAEVVASFPVYRTYVIEKPSAQDRRFIDWAIGRARRRGRAADPSVLDFIRSVLLGDLPPGAPESLLDGYRAFTQRLQQYTSPVTAKGIEDTAFYRHQRLIALNEVGGEPDVFGMTVNAFHGASRDRAQRWPHTMLASSTHDTKRSEDVRARLDVISELPAMWRLAVRRWSRINRSKRRIVEGASAPSRNDEYLLYQILIGSFPVGEIGERELATYRARVVEYMLKATREAKSHTSWINPNEAYEQALAEFIVALLARIDGNLFIDDLRAALPPFARWGAYNALSMALLKMASPGVPDIYQGEELLELALVDPDNRRPVDYDRRRSLLDQMSPIAAGADETAISALRERPEDGRAKLWGIWRALQLRREKAELFARGSYQPLAAQGERARHVVAFAREHQGAAVVVVAARLYASLQIDPAAPPTGEIWSQTSVELPELPAADGWHDVLSGRRFLAGSRTLALAQLFATLPVALLVSEAAA
jgi:(1->4)-alpha-D-glucan 1-alpha-D-glucosylmutase